MFRGVVGKLVVGEDSSWNNVRSDMKSSMAVCSSSAHVDDKQLAFYSGINRRAASATPHVKK